jgi:hypothetical protein
MEECDNSKIHISSKFILLEMPASFPVHYYVLILKFEGLEYETVKCR